MTEALGARVRILDAAERLFADNGFDATPTSKIAKLAGVPKGLLFYYFPSKADLLRALVAERLSLGPIDTDAIVKPGDPAQSLLNLTSRIHELQGNSAVLRVIIWREQHTHPEVMANLVKHRGHIQSVIERVLQASLHKPVAAARLRTAALAWLDILTARTAPANAAGAHTPSADLRALAEFITDGLVHSARARSRRLTTP